MGNLVMKPWLHDSIYPLLQQGLTCTAERLCACPFEKPIDVTRIIQSSVTVVQSDNFNHMRLASNKTVHWTPFKKFDYLFF